MFNPAILTNPDLIVHCTTEAQAKSLLSWAASHGKCWSFEGPSLANYTNFETNKHMTYYRISKGTYGKVGLHAFTDTLLSYNQALVTIIKEL